MDREEEINRQAETYKGYVADASFVFAKGAKWADLHPSTELIKNVAEQILIFNHITPDCWSQWTADGCVEQIKKNLER